MASQAAKGPARGEDRIRAPKPAAPRWLLMEILSRNPLSDDLAQAVWVYCVFLLRVLSEWFQLVRQLPHERMAEDPALNAPGVVGTWKGQLAMKLQRVKHSARRSRLV